MRGSEMKAHLREIEEIIENSDATETILRKDQNLNDILAHTLNTVPYYQKLKIQQPKLEYFPVMDKSEIRNNFDAFISRDFLDKKTFKVVTSGSTGTPFTVLQNEGKRKRNGADTMYFAKRAGYKLGTKLFFMRVWGDKMGLKSRIANFARNIFPIDVLRLNSTKIPDLLTIISQTPGNKSFLGYCSAMDQISDYLERTENSYDFGKVDSIITISESLQDATRSTIERSFDCKVYSRYSNNENGILSQEVPGLGKNFILNLASYKFEILSLDEDVIVKDGTLGRIVVTDLFNKALPMIRYDTGDVGIMEKIEINGKPYPVLSKVEGRKMDLVYDTDGNLISSFLFSTKMKEYTEIVQFQFIQHTQKKYEFKLNTEDEFLKQPKLVGEFKNILGKDAQIQVTYVDEIPVLSSGKRKKVMSLL